MGRNKIDPSKLIDNDRERAVRYRKRKSGFENKGAELSSMTGTDVVIICMPRHNTGQPSLFTSGPTVTSDNWQSVVQEFCELSDAKSDPEQAKQKPKRRKTLHPAEPPRQQPIEEIKFENNAGITIEVTPRNLTIWPSLRPHA